MDLWWGEAWHRGHEEKIKRTLRSVYGPRFICSNSRVLHLLSLGDEPCEASIAFAWMSKWGQPGQIKVKIYCYCAEINEFFYAFLSNDGDLVSDTIAEWKLPVAA